MANKRCRGGDTTSGRPLPWRPPRRPDLDKRRHARSRCTEQQDRWEFMVEPGQLPGELHARRATTTDQPRLWLVIHVRIIGVRECRHGTGKFVRRASVEATSVVGDRARVRRLRRIRSLRISGRPAQTAAALAGACGQAASHPRIGGTGVPAPGLSEQASNYVSMTDIACSQRRAFPPSPLDTAAARAEKLGVMRSNTWSARLARQPPTDPEDFPRSTARGGAWTGILARIKRPSGPL